MRKVIVNGRFLLHRTTGVERYAREILRELDNLIDPGEIVLAYPPGTKEVPAYRHIEAVQVGKLQNILWEHISFPFYVKRQHAVSLNLCNTAPLCSPGIVCIHDMKIRAVPEFYSKKFLLWYRILFHNETKRAKAIITVSQFSKEEIGRYYSVDPKRIFVIPNAWQHYERISYAQGVLEKFELRQNEYYFSLCSLEPNKNMRWIANEAKKNPNRIFAIAGGISPEVFASGVGFDPLSNMRLLGYVSDEEAKTLMRDCRAFLFPSFYEGFGIPPLEAVSAGAKRIVLSDIPVLHEIFGETANYVDPNSYDANLEQLKEIDAQGVLDRYSWKASAAMLKELLESDLR